VPRIREVPAKSSTLTGGVASTYIQFLTKPKAFSQIIAVSGLQVVKERQYEDAGPHYHTGGLGWGLGCRV
jgi:hypothetical protein